MIGDHMHRLLENRRRLPDRQVQIRIVLSHLRVVGIIRRGETFHASLLFKRDLVHLARSKVQQSRVVLVAKHSTQFEFSLELFANHLASAQLAIRTRHIHNIDQSGADALRSNDLFSLPSFRQHGRERRRRVLVICGLICISSTSRLLGFVGVLLLARIALLLVVLCLLLWPLLPVMSMLGLLMMMVVVVLGGGLWPVLVGIVWPVRVIRVRPVLSWVRVRLVAVVVVVMAVAVVVVVRV